MKKVLYLLLAVSLFFYACQKTQDFALNLLPESDIINSYYIDTFTVNIKTEPFTHVQTNGKGYVLFGSYYDPIFGYTKASFITQVQQFAYPKFSDSIDYTVDSVVLTFQLAKDFTPYGKPFNPVPIYVYEVTDTLFYYLKYYADEDPAKYTNFKLLGQGEFSLYSSGNDSLIKIYLNNELGQLFLDSVNYYFYTEDEPFTYRFKGLYITPGDGYYDAAIYKLDFVFNPPVNFAYSRLNIYYHPDTLPDTSLVYMLFITNLKNAHFTLFSHDYTGSNVFNPQIDSVVYLQTAGTRLKLEFPFIRFLSNKIVYKAQLILTLEDPQYTYETSFPPPDNIYIVGFDSQDSTQKPIFIEDYYDPKLRQYKGAPKQINKYSLAITRIIQGMINSESTDTSNINYYILDISGSDQLARAVLTTQKNSKPLKLVIFYSNY